MPEKPESLLLEKPLRPFRPLRLLEPLLSWRPERELHPRIAVLQTTALLLGYQADVKGLLGLHPKSIVSLLSLVSFVSLRNIPDNFLYFKPKACYYENIMTEQTKKMIIIDGNAIVHRAYHAIPPLTTKKGEMVNAVYGFVSMLLRVWRQLKPDYVAVTFDMAGKTFRHEKFDQYKATRVKADQALYDQIPLVHQVVEAFGLPIFEKSGYEADDVIGTVVRQVSQACLPDRQVHQVESPKVEVFIVTGDMDTLQLVSEDVKVFTLRKGLNDTVVYDIATVKERFGFGPEMVVDYKALRGDTSDNIPGVPGVGEKTATELIQKYGSIESIYKDVEKLDVKPGVLKKLVEGAESAKMSKYLATIDCNVPDLNFDLENCKIRSFDKDKIVEIFQRFEFASLLKRIPELGGELLGSGEITDIKQQTAGVGLDGKKQKTSFGNKKADFTFVEVKSEAEVEHICKLVVEGKQFYAEALLRGKDIFNDKLEGLLVLVGKEIFYVREKYLEDIKKIFFHEEVELGGHNVKELVKILKLKNILVKNKLFDVMIASYLLNPGSRAHDVASIVLKELGQSVANTQEQSNLFGIDPRLKANELFLLSQCGLSLKTELVKTADYSLMKEIEMPLIYVLADMEVAGVALDLKLLNKLSVKINKQIGEVSKEIFALSGEEFNISSPLQLREILFTKLAIPVFGIKKGKTGLSTSADSLEKLHGVHPIIEKIEVYREICKLQNTYVDVLPGLVNPKTHRLHALFNQAVAATGRLSSSDPNLQNIPIRTELGREIRDAFVAEPGNVLISADYSQIELRIVASLAEDKKMMEIFENGLDIHAATAAAINDVPLEKVTKEMRYAAKEVNFGVLYGMGVYGLASRTGISRELAREFIEKYFVEFSGVKKYIDETIEFVKKNGYCETLFGRRRYLPELTSTNFQVRSSAERMAVNHPIQGTEADIVKKAMIEVYKKLNEFDESKKHKTPAAHILMQVHDELVLEVKEDCVEEVSKILKDTMESVVKLKVPVKVEVHAGKNWGEVH